jgi:hypothetical protein
MRISEDRYSRDLRRINLAQRLIRHEVRTQWICAWTGLSDDRVRNLFRSYDKTSGRVQRHRGPSPTRLAAFLRSPTLRAEASAIGGLACAMRVLPPKAAPDARRDPWVEGGERLCQVFELYGQIVPQSRFTMDQFIVLVNALAEGDDLALGHCSTCHGALLMDRLGANRRLCVACKQDSLRKSVRARSDKPTNGHTAADTAEEDIEPEAQQQSLF